MIGPHDKRGRIRRCAACAGRKIKCDGGYPCRHCTRLGRECVPPESNLRKSLVIIQNYKPPSPIVQLPPTAQSLTVPPAMPLDWPSRMAKHFFSEFISTHDFIGSEHLDVTTIASLQQSHPSMRNAISAVAMLDASRRSQSLSSTQRRAVSLMALKAYRQSLVVLQKDLEAMCLLGSDACLWSTFFLGIFELMYDVTGDGWIKHILYGTCKILQVRGPAAHVSGPGRSFFLLVRVFEISRALIYNESTFLDAPEWRELMSNIWNDDCKEWHPKETLYDLMTSCTTLSVRGHNLDQQITPATAEELIDMANTGFDVQASLYSWFSQASSQFDAEMPGLNKHYLKRDPAWLLSNIYYHATLIFLSGIFDYRNYWDNMATPTLPTSEIQDHVSAILEMVEIALKTTNLAGLLFLFPLRVAGARARSSTQRAAILRMLQNISSKNFIVAGAFLGDLTELWQTPSEVNLNPSMTDDSLFEVGSSVI